MLLGVSLATRARLQSVDVRRSLCHVCHILIPWIARVALCKAKHSHGLEQPCS